MSLNKSWKCDFCKKNDNFDYLGTLAFVCIM